MEIRHKDAPDEPPVGEDFERDLDALAGGSPDPEPADDDGGDDDDSGEGKAEPIETLKGDPPAADPELVEPEAEPEPSANDRVLAEINAALEELKAQRERAPKEPEAEPEIPVPAHLQKLLDHDDPGVRDVGAALLEQHKAEVEHAANEEKTARAAERAGELIQAVRDKHGLNQDEIDLLVYRYTDRSSGKALSESLTFDAAAEKFYPGRAKAKAAATKAGAPKNGADGGTKPAAPRMVVTRPATPVIDRGGSDSGASPAVRERSEPRNVQAVVDRAFEGFPGL